MTARRVFLRTTALAVVLPACVAWAQTEPDAASRTSALAPIAEGRFSVFAMPPAWLRRHWRGPPIEGLYFALLSPNARAIADDVGPCAAPSRLVAVITHEGGSAPTEVQLEYYDFCSARAQRQRWPTGTAAFVQAIEVRPLDTGEVEIEQVFAHRSGASAGAPVRRTRTVRLDALYARARAVPAPAR